MAFELPFPPFPHDSRDVPFIATPDDNNGYAVPSSQYFKKLVGEKYLWTPVSSTDPLPSSDAAAQAKLADILTKLSADPATQTTLAQILAKIIDAPATEAKQTALNALVGEVQAAPTPNTLLARLKNLETKVDAIIADGLKLSGSIPAKTVVETLSNASSVAAASDLDLTITTSGESEIWFLVNIDKQPWSLLSNSVFEGAGRFPAATSPLYPIRKNVVDVYIGSYTPNVILYTGISFEGSFGLSAPTSLLEAKKLCVPHSSEHDLLLRLTNSSTETATVTIKILRVWR